MKAQVGGMSKLLKLQKAGADPQKANSLLQVRVRAARMTQNEFAGVCFKRENVSEVRYARTRQ